MTARSRSKERSNKRAASSSSSSSSGSRSSSSGSSRSSSSGSSSSGSSGSSSSSSSASSRSRGSKRKSQAAPAPPPSARRYTRSPVANVNNKRPTNGCHGDGDAGGHRSKSPRRGRGDSPSRGNKKRKSRSTSRSKRSDSPRPLKIHVGKLTRNVQVCHLTEIFGMFGNVCRVELPNERIHPEINRGFAYIEYDNADSVLSAIKHMDGGMVDLQEVHLTPVFSSATTRGCTS